MQEKSIKAKSTPERKSDEKESCSTGFSACGGSRKRHSTIPPHLVKGHTLVIPKQEIDYIFDLSDDDLAAMHVFAKSVARAIEKAVPCKRVGVAVMGLEVPHAHIHLIPINKESDMIISNPKLKLSDEEFKEIAGSIHQAWMK